MVRSAVPRKTCAFWGALFFGWATVSSAQLDTTPKEGPPRTPCNGAPLVINEAMVEHEAGVPTVLDIDGDPTDWFEVRNISNAAINLSQYSFSDGTSFWSPASFISLLLPAGGTQLIFASGKNQVVSGPGGLELHANFKLSAGETLSIFSSGTAPIHSLVLPADLRLDDSYGLIPDGNCGNRRYFDHFDKPLGAAFGPTAGTNNSVFPFNYAGYTPDPTITPASGMAASGNGVVQAVPQATLHYSLDGSAPAMGSSPTAFEQYVFGITGCIQIRALAKKPDYIRSRVVSETYLNNGRVHQLPVFLITGAPADITALYASTNETEWPVNVKYLVAGSPVLSQDAGIQVNASGASSQLPQRPLELIARDSYGADRFEYPFFATKLGVDKFKSLLLRNGGADASSNDWSKTLVREPSAHLLMSGDPADIAVDYQGYQPVVVYLNCGYYGIHQLREKVNHHFVESNYGIDADGVNFYKPNDDSSSNGSPTFQSVEQGVAAVPPASRWDYLHSGASGVDYNEFISYHAAERYLDNGDWPGNNMALWQPGGGSYRWVLWDLDSCFGSGTLHLTYPTNPFFASVMASPEALDDFGQHVAARASITFRPGVAVGVVNSMAAEIASEMANPADESDPRYHIGRWKSAGGIQSLAAWEGALQSLRDYYTGRPQVALSGLLGSNYFSAPGTFALTFEREGVGEVRAQRVPVPGFPFVGTFFTNTPLELSATPAAGYTFEGWYLGSVAPANLLSNDSVYSRVTNASAETIVANFLPPPQYTQILFSEIHHNSSPAEDTEDWVELFNNTAQSIDLSGATFEDSDGNSFMIPWGTSIGPFGFLILCRDATKFAENVGGPPWVNPSCIDWGTFGLNEDDSVALTDFGGNPMQIVDYASTAPWEIQPAAGDSLQFMPLSGGWPTSEHNGLAENWFYPAYNTPGWIFH